MKFLKRFNEGYIQMDKTPIHKDFFKEQSLQSMFGISILDIQDVVQDVLDEGLIGSIDIWDKNRFVISFERDYDISSDASTWMFSRYLVTRHVNEINKNLHPYGLCVEFISNKEDSKEDRSFAVNLFIKPIDKRITESKNVTKAEEETKLRKLFGIESEDVKTWFQDFLDEYLELDFEVSIINDKHFVVNIYNQDALNNQYNRGDWSKYTITKERYPVSDELIKFIQDRLNYYDLKLNRGSNNYVEYSANGTYMGFSIAKVPNRSYL